MFGEVENENIKRVLQKRKRDLHITEFQKKFATEKDCLDYLFKLKWPDGFTCPKCGHTKYYLIEKRMRQVQKADLSGVALIDDVCFGGVKVGKKRGRVPEKLTYILGTYHGLPEKHPAGYLNEYCYRLNRRFCEHIVFGKLVSACVITPPITFAELT